MGPGDGITVSVAYALPDRQSVVTLQLPEGTTAREAVERSGLAAVHPDIASRPCDLAVFGRVVPDSQVLKPGDRVEILRPLVRDPRDRRRQLAARARKPGRKGGSAG